MKSDVREISDLEKADAVIRWLDHRKAGPYGATDEEIRKWLKESGERFAKTLPDL